jgi:hypothetical protein
VKRRPQGESAEAARRRTAARRRLDEVRALLSRPGLDDWARAALTRERQALHARLTGAGQEG